MMCSQKMRKGLKKLTETSIQIVRRSAPRQSLYGSQKKTRGSAVERRMRLSPWSTITHKLTNKSSSTGTFPLLVTATFALSSSLLWTPSAVSLSFTSSSSRNHFTMTTRASSASSTDVQTGDKDLANVKSALENSWVRQLSQETEENLKKSRRSESLDVVLDDNRNKRPVFNGHYVLVKPSGLKKPRLVLWSKDVAEALHLSKEQVESDEFLQWVSGNSVLGETWATPYALSIMGTRYTNNCPYRTGNGYGDGRAISIGELHGLELQMKGAGKTPFSRGADGRAVLRSSIREFLASEANHYLGVPTTRALSLIVSEEDKIMRPWYSDDAVLNIPKSVDDPRLQRYAAAERPKIIAYLRNEKADPNIMVTEKAAISTRVAPSFMRIGHIDLFARRAQKTKTSRGYDTSSNEWKELEEIIWHACYREFREEAHDPFFDEKDIASAATILLEQSADRISTMVANWIRVGFAQGNFNADNCLVSGKTMDYGPFGWLEEYNPLFAKWTGSGQHFGFMNQPSAGFVNYNVLVESVVPVILAKGSSQDNDDESEDAMVKSFMDKAQSLFEGKVAEAFRIKLGFKKDMDVGDEIWQSLETLMRDSRTDWTLLFRQLTYVMRDFSDLSSTDYQGMMALLEGNDADRPGSSPFYEAISAEQRQSWLSWIEQWRQALASTSDSSAAAFERMRLANPKYVLREWMLVDAYTSAAQNDYAEVSDLFQLIQRPYEEGSSNEVNKFYRRAPDEALTSGGTAFMS